MSPSPSAPCSSAEPAPPGVSGWMVGNPGGGRGSGELPVPAAARTGSRTSCGMLARKVGMSYGLGFFSSVNAKVTESGSLCMRSKIPAKSTCSNASSSSTPTFSAAPGTTTGCRISSSESSSSHGHAMIHVDGPR